ncbi:MULTISPECIES: FAD-dependent oxidoreductase [unclassified Synechococcus]|uniref:FAD-dependent oxidoreductase n=1 Tax=unclassified Synechococcus TaxID=2626047 RepID=UPI0002F7D64F|nr:MULTISPECIES: FAD-dependent oxidoreductase [unclassified Synechococcus]WFN58479.1 FAD-dependent oxidoreductase [Synechococcus sp. CCFWC 502]
MGARDDQAAVVVWGGGSGGVTAALQAARNGADTLLLTPGPWLGGMVSAAGVCAPDGNELSPWQSGLWGALLRALQREEPEGLDHNWVSCFGWRPASAERVLRGWVAAEPRLRWWSGCRLRQLERSGSRLTAMELEHQGELVRLTLQLAIDGSDRGDLLPLAQVPFRLGWEASEDWGEPSAPTRERLKTDPFFQHQPVQSPTWVVLGQESAGPCPGGAIPAAPFERATEHFGLERTLSYGRLPGGLVMLNWPLHGNDWHDGLEGAFNAEATVQAELERAMQEHSLAFLGALREASGGWLQPARVFPEAPGAGSALAGASSLALMPYWREGRRLMGHRLVLEQDLLPLIPAGARGTPDDDGAWIGPIPLDGEGRCSAIAVGNYANDHHYPGDDWPLAPKSCRWGGRWSGTPFMIPYGALVSADLDNLLAADKAISCSHMANGATRLQPLILNIGQAAGAAAGLCVASGTTPASLDVRLLQEALISDPVAPAGPMPLWDTPWHHPEWKDRQRRALQDPGLLQPRGTLADSEPASPFQAPVEPHEQVFAGTLVPDGAGGYILESHGRPWPLITLEPGLYHWLRRQESSRPVRLIGVANPWGPWLRVSRLEAGSEPA